MGEDGDLWSEQRIEMEGNELGSTGVSSGKRCDHRLQLITTHDWVLTVSRRVTTRRT